MGSEGERKSYSRILALTVLLIITVCSCRIGRIYVGSEIRDDPRERIVNGTTRKSEILKIFGPTGFRSSTMEISSSMIMSERTPVA